MDDALLPIAMLFPALVFFVNVSVPIAMLFVPEVLLDNDLLPIAIFVDIELFPNPIVIPFTEISSLKLAIPDTSSGYIGFINPIPTFPIE